MLNCLFAFINSNSPNDDNNTQKSPKISTSETNICNDLTHCSNDPDDSSQIEMISITSETYRNLLNTTVELHKAEKNIQKLESLLQKKEDKIKHLMTQLDMAKPRFNMDFSPVSVIDV